LNFHLIHTNRHLETIRKRVGKAIGEFDLIAQGDKIAVGISGGKDSMTLLYILSYLKTYAPVDFTLQAVMVDMGRNSDFKAVHDYCDFLQVPFHTEKTEIAKIVFEKRQEKNPCSLCANLRRGALNNAAKNLGCNKVALGHHLDDVIETLFLGMFYEGRIHTFSPKIHLSRVDLTVIRPLVLVNEKTIIKASQDLKIPKQKANCPIEGSTKRAEMKKTIEELSKRIPNVREKMLSALRNIDVDPMWDRD